MHKKSFILLSVVLFVLCICSGFVCATNDVKNGVSNVTNTVVDGVNRLGEDVRNGIGNAENGIEDALRMDDRNTVNNNNANTTNTDNATGATNETGATNRTGMGTTGDYTATRTTADATTTNNTSNLWIWLIVAIAAIVVIGLVWYYGAQNNTHNND